MGVGRLVARSGRALWATVRILHFTLSEWGSLGLLNCGGTESDLVFPGPIWLPAENGL